MFLRSEEALSWLFIAVLLTSLLGYFVHRTARSSINNGRWDALPENKKRQIGASGIFASLLAGLSGIYIAPAPGNMNEFVRTLAGILFAQVLAGWLGSEAIRRYSKGGDKSG